MPGLLPALRDVFGEPAVWTSPELHAVTIQGRFRIDPYDVPLGGQPEGLNVTQTWFYVDRADIPSVGTPQLGELLFIRGEWWEIMQIDRDDIGELAWRLLKAEAPRR